MLTRRHTPCPERTLLLALLLLISTTAVASAQKGVSVVSKRGRFSVTLPDRFGKPVEKNNSVPVDDGVITEMTFTSNTDHEVVVITCVEYPNMLMSDRMGAGARLRHLHEELLERYESSRTERDEPIELDGYPGRAIVFSSRSRAGAIHRRVRSYCVDERIYQIMYTSDRKSDLWSKGAERFFSSFQLTSPPSTADRLYVSKQSSFSITFPGAFGEPFERKIHRPTHLGNVVAWVCLAQSTRRNGMTMVTCTNYPEVGTLKVETLIDSIQASVMENFDGKELLWQEEVALDGHPGRAFIFTASDRLGKRVGRVELYVVGYRLYCILYGSDSFEDVKSESAEAFFRSFTLLDD